MLELLCTIGLVALWVFAFLGVALIYPVPYFGKKANLSKTVLTTYKVVGVVISVICLAILYLTGGFN